MLKYYRTDVPAAADIGAVIFNERRRRYDFKQNFCRIVLLLTCFRVSEER